MTVHGDFFKTFINKRRTLCGHETVLHFRFGNCHIGRIIVTFLLPGCLFLKHQALRECVVEEEQVLVVDYYLRSLNRLFAGRSIAIHKIIYQHSMFGAADAAGISAGRDILISYDCTVDDIASVGAVGLYAGYIYICFIAGDKAIVYSCITLDMYTSSFTTHIVPDDAVVDTGPVFTVVGSEH